MAASTALNAHSGDARTAQTMMGIRTSAVTMRFIESASLSTGAHCFHGAIHWNHFANSAESPVTLLIVEDRAQQFAARKIRPQRFCDVKFRVCDLPQQEVRNAHLARQIGRA